MVSQKDFAKPFFLGALTKNQGNDVSLVNKSDQNKQKRFDFY